MHTLPSPNVVLFRAPQPQKLYRVRKYHGVDKPSLTVEQLTRFLDVAKKYGRREFAMFITAFVHGLRASEICNLLVTDVDFAANEIDLHRAKNGKPSRQLMQRAAGYCEAHVLQLYLQERATRPGSESPYLFISQKPNGDGSRQLSTAQVYRLFVAICQQAGIPPQFQHPHVLRHTAGFLYRQAGMDIEAIADVLGHRNIASTMVYTRPNRGQLNGLVSKALKKLF